MASHSSTLAWKIPWTKDPGGPQSMGSLRVGHDRATSLSLFTFMHWRRKWQPTPVFLPGESQGRGSLVGCHLWGRTESDTTEATQQQQQQQQQHRQNIRDCFRIMIFEHSIFGIRSAETRSGADCVSDHELLIGKLRLKLKKVGKTTRPCRQDLNQISNDYTVEVKHRFKGLDLIDTVPGELWTEEPGGLQSMGSLRVGHD